MVVHVKNFNFHCAGSHTTRINVVRSVNSESVLVFFLAIKRRIRIKHSTAAINCELVIQISSGNTVGQGTVFSAVEVVRADRHHRGTHGLVFAHVAEEQALVKLRSIIVHIYNENSQQLEGGPGRSAFICDRNVKNILGRGLVVQGPQQLEQPRVRIQGKLFKAFAIPIMLYFVRHFTIAT